MTPGKQFENDFINSLPKHIFKYRLKDGTASWGSNQAENVRFQASNICDFIVHNGKCLYLLELKSHKGKSLPLSCIRPNQLKGLWNAENYENVVAYIVVNFRELNETYIINVSDIIHYMGHNMDKKSIPISLFKEVGVLIPQTLKKVHYSYDLGLFEGVS